MLHTKDALSTPEGKTESAGAKNMTGIGLPTTVQASAFIEPITPAALRDFLAGLRRSGAWPVIKTSMRTIGWIAIGVLLAVVIAAVVVMTTVVSAVTGDLGGVGVSVTVGLALIVVVGLVIGAVVSSHRARRRRWYRLARFAQANGLEYVPQVHDPGYSGMIFGRGGDRMSMDVVRDPAHSVEVANYRYSTGSSQHRRTHRWGYITIGLQNSLPNIVLDATSNNSFLGSDLPSTLAKNQRLHLEGDFDQHFALYCPVGYEADALYLFTPDIMARFIDNAAALDVEIVDNRLLLYGRRDLSTLDEATWQWIFSIVSALEVKFAQWERWRDDRLAGTSSATAASSPAAAGAAVPGAAVSSAAVSAPPLLRPPPGVAPQGRRLRRSVSALAVVFGIFALLVWVAVHLFQFGLFTR